MKRRQFLSAVVAVPVAAAVAPYLPAPKPTLPFSVPYITTFENPCRLDLLYGVATPRPNVAVRVLA